MCSGNIKNAIICNNEKVRKASNPESSKNFGATDNINSKWRIPSFQVFKCGGLVRLSLFKPAGISIILAFAFRAFIKSSLANSIPEDCIFHCS